MLGGTEVRSQTAGHGLTEGVGFRRWVVMVSLLLPEEKVGMTYGVVGYTRRLRGLVLSRSRDLESEGVRGFAENRDLWWTRQTPFDAGGSWPNQIEQSTRCNHVENRQNGRLCVAVNTAFPSACAGGDRCP